MKMSAFILLCAFFFVLLHAESMERLERNTGLVLEGGGMRGVFTCGVLDAFMKHGVEFPYVVAVSAGACNGMSYISRQPRRARFSNIDLLQKYGYISLKNLLVKGSIFDPTLLYERFPNDILRLRSLCAESCHDGDGLHELPDGTGRISQ